MRSTIFSPAWLLSSKQSELLLFPYVVASMPMKIIILSLLLVACQKKPVIPSPLPQGNTVARAYTWLALGDSYTIGQGVSSTERFPFQTAVWLAQNGKAVNSPDYIATTGWTTGTLINSVSNQNPGNYDIVSLLIGVNDQYQTHDTTGYRTKFSYLLEKAIHIARGDKSHVFVLSIPDYSVTPFAVYSDTARIRKEIDQFNIINKSVTLEYGCSYLDITPSTREARLNRELLAPDGLHPSGLEYKKWAERLGPIIQPVLK